jgi:hypothetical protein
MTIESEQGTAPDETRITKQKRLAKNDSNKRTFAKNHF